METARHIAVVSDDAAFRDGLAATLAGADNRSSSFANGSAMAAVRREMPALVVVDVDAERPQAGWRVAALLRLDPALSVLPLVACAPPDAFLRDYRDHLREGLHGPAEAIPIKWIAGSDSRQSGGW